VIQLTEQEHADLLKCIEAAEKFKTFVHAYLDQHGVPHGDPTNQHQVEGCRIGARLDLLFAQREGLLAQCKLALAYLNTPGCHIEFRQGPPPEYPNGLEAAIAKAEVPS
jgi:hypothetical protein